MINLVEVVQQNERVFLREIIINPSHVVSVVPDEDSAAMNANGKLPDGLHAAQQFSKVKLVDGKQKNCFSGDFFLDKSFFI